ncbi:MAG: lysozyme inhibitor LprI family protein [Verrucomicrobiota bacterium]
MKYQLSLLLTAVLFLAFASSLEAQTQAEMNRQAAEDFEAADQKINETYQALIAAHGADAPAIERLRATQRVWIQYVDLHLDYLYPVGENEDPRALYGSMYPLLVMGAKTQLFEQRISLLAQELESLRL